MAMAMAMGIVTATTMRLADGVEGKGKVCKGDGNGNEEQGDGNGIKNCK